MMNSLQFKYLAARNFLPFGPKGIQIDLTKLSRIVNVRGINNDNKTVDQEDKVSSNGTGKSSLIDLITWTIFGKTVKNSTKIKVDGVINNLIGKDCETEVRWDNFRVVRGRKPKKLELYESETGDWENAKSLTVDNDEMQDIIEEKFGFSYEAFLTVCIFTDDNRNCFLECDGPTKRAIVESILDLTSLKFKNDNAKRSIKEIDDSIKLKSKEYDIFVSNKNNAEMRLEQLKGKEISWRTTKATELKGIVDSIKSKKSMMETSSAGNDLLKYQTAQERIVELNKLLNDLESVQTADQSSYNVAKQEWEATKEEFKKISTELQELQTKAKEAKDKIATKQAEISDLTNNECSKCKKKVYSDEEVLISKKKLEDEIAEQETVLAGLKATAVSTQALAVDLKPRQEAAKTLATSLETKLNSVAEQLKTYRKEIVVCSNVPQPKIDDKTSILEQEIKDLKRKYDEKKVESEGETPYQEVIATTSQEIVEATKIAEDKRLEVKQLELDAPYHKYWLKAYGDNGIRKWAIDEIIPALNANLAYWMQYLIDNKIELKFDNKLDETIRRIPYDGNPFIYHAMSGGERRRLNLAVSQAFAHLVMIAHATIPSLVFLDEVTTNIDQVGVQGIYNMIVELSRDKQVFVTTHDVALLELLEGCDTLVLKKENNITELIESV